jgi:3-oxoadipate enol-lactonase
MKQRKINNLNVYDYEGNGNPLIFVHAFPLCSRMWDKQVNYFKDKYRVITYDLRALGYSTKEDLQYTMETLVNDFFEITDSLKLKRVNACGLSIGGYILLRALVKNPTIFNSVILADTKSEKDTDEALLNRCNTIIDIRNGKRKEFEVSFTKNLLSEKNYENTEIRKFVEEMISSQSNEGICSNLIALATRTNVIDYLTQIDIPALILVGEYDKLTPLEFSDKMKICFKNPELKIIKNAGHLSNLENPDDFNKAVLDFIKIYSS